MAINRNRQPYWGSLITDPATRRKLAAILAADVVGFSLMMLKERVPIRHSNSSCRAVFIIYLSCYCSPSAVNHACILSR
jgi:hypothetical protein